MLERRNTQLDNRRTSISLEPTFWHQVDSILEEEGIDLHLLCKELDNRRRQSSMALSMRVFAMLYFKTKSDALSADPILKEPKHHYEPATPSVQPQILLLALRAFSQAEDDSGDYPVSTYASDRPALS